MYIQTGDCLCSVAPPHGAVAWSSVCDCVISLSRSFSYWQSQMSYPGHSTDPQLQPLDLLARDHCFYQGIANIVQ